MNNQPYGTLFLTNVGAKVHFSWRTTKSGRYFFRGIDDGSCSIVRREREQCPSKIHVSEGRNIFHLAHHSMKTSIVRYCVATRLPCSSSRRGPWLWPWGSRWRSEWRSAIPVFSFHPWFFFLFKGLTNEVFSLISLTMLGHAKKTTDTTFTIFYNQVCFVNSIFSMSLGWVKKTTKTTFTTSNNASPGHCLFEAEGCL